ncbi:hypothetical protein D9M72_521020 [compost metagenome]
MQHPAEVNQGVRGLGDVVLQILFQDVEFTGMEQRQQVASHHEFSVFKAPVTAIGKDVLNVHDYLDCRHGTSGECQRLCQ